MAKDVAVLIFLVLVTGCAAASFAGSDAVLKPSELAANPDKYDGQHVRIQGYVVIKPEGRNIFDSKEGYENPKGACLAVDGPEVIFDDFHSRVEVLSGIFRRELCRKNEVCRFWCNDSGIELDSGSRP